MTWARAALAELGARRRAARDLWYLDRENGRPLYRRVFYWLRHMATGRS